MDNNEDWKELEKWSKNDEEKKQYKYGVDLSKVNIEKENKKVGIISKILDKMTTILLVLRVIGIIAFVIGLFAFMLYIYSTVS